MQYSVPQFVDVEDKIIGPLGLRQFLIFLFGGLLCLFYWSLLRYSAGFFLLAIPTMLVMAYFALGKFNGRPVTTSLLGSIGFFMSPRVRIFLRTGEQAMPLVQKAAAPGRPGAPAPATPSRLKRLAYFLDQKAAEEERLVESGQLKQKWLNQI